MEINLTHDDLQRICYHLQCIKKENKLTDDDISTLLKIEAIVIDYSHDHKILASQWNWSMFESDSR